jgi:phosphonoacetate hydrolase
MLPGMSNPRPSLLWLLVIFILGACAAEAPKELPDSNFPDVTAVELQPDTYVTCELLPSELASLMLPGFEPMPASSGIDAEEISVTKIEEVAAAASDVFFWATYNHETEAYSLKRSVDGSTRELTFRRSPKVSNRAAFDVLSGTISDFFKSTDPLHLSELSELNEAYQNPNEQVYSDLGYALDEPRMGFLNVDTTSYPLALERIAGLFQASTAPDVIVEFKPDSKKGPGTHGCLDVLQSRATLILGGAGSKANVVLDEVAALTDVAPTILAALGAPTTEGRSLLGEFSEGLYLKRQDGRVLVEALDLSDCQHAKHAVVILLDGLMASEINHQILSDDPDIDLPHMRSIAEQGVVYRGGAVTNWPSFSAPGHMTVGTGVWSGHHGIVNNSFHDRKEHTTISFFGFISKPEMLVQDSSAFLKVYEQHVHPEIETLAQAAHRAFGPWDPDTNEGAFVAVLNDLPILGADRSSFDLLAPTSPSFTHNLDLTNLADDFALNQALSLLEDASLPTPKILQLSFYTTDKAGEEAGPHSDLLRASLPSMDARIGELMDAYEARDARKDTLWVLVSDHGMALQDPSVTRTFAAQLSETGVKLTNVSGMLYLHTLGLDITMDGLAATVVVRDHGNGKPVAMATVKCSGCDPKSGQTGEDGTLLFKVPAGAIVDFNATHPNFNPKEKTIGTPLTE